MLNHHWITLSNVFLYLTFIRKCPSPTAPGSFTRPSDGTTRHSSTRLSHTLWHFDLCVLRMAHELRSSQIHVNKAFVGENRAALWGRWFWMGFAILSICTLYIYTILYYIDLYCTINLELIDLVPNQASFLRSRSISRLDPSISPGTVARHCLGFDAEGGRGGLTGNQVERYLMW